jgi:hypothetical protein
LPCLGPSPRPSALTMPPVVREGRHPQHGRFQDFAFALNDFTSGVGSPYARGRPALTNHFPPAIYGYHLCQFDWQLPNAIMSRLPEGMSSAPPQPRRSASLAQSLPPQPRTATLPFRFCFPPCNSRTRSCPLKPGARTHAKLFPKPSTLPIFTKDFPHTPPILPA